MCLTCGCFEPSNRHGDSRNLTLRDFQEAADAASIKTPDAIRNAWQWLTHIRSSVVGLSPLPDISIDIDGTLALDTHAYLAIVNAALGTNYRYTDVVRYHDWSWTSDPAKAEDAVHAFRRSDECAWSVAPDYAAIAAARSMYDAGFHITIATLRNPRHEEATRSWLAQWGVPYHELRMGKGSKRSVADEHDAERPVVLIDDCADFLDLVKPGADLLLLRRPYTPSFGDISKAVLIDTWQQALRYVGVAQIPEVPQLDVPINVTAPASVTKSKSVHAAGIACIALDTGRILMLQRDFKDTSKQAAGRWEFPGGRLDDGEDPYAAAKREFKEETGQPLPAGELVDNWKQGGYQGFVYTISAESEIKLRARGDGSEIMAWWRIKDAKKSDHALRDEFEDFDWDVIEEHVPANKASSGVLISPRKDPKRNALRDQLHQTLIAAAGSPNTFRDTASASLRDAYQQAYVMGASLYDSGDDSGAEGDDDEDDGSDAAAQQRSDAIQDYLEGFASALIAQSLSDSQVDQRSGLYADTIDGAYFDGAGDAAAGDGVQVLTWIAGYSEHGCQLCEDRDNTTAVWGGLPDDDLSGNNDPQWDDGFQGWPGDGDLGDGCEGYCACEVSG